MLPEQLHEAATVRGLAPVLPWVRVDVELVIEVAPGRGGQVPDTTHKAGD
ncbi:hypothetical protein [Streptomyces antnestii]|nr:hypothetical protein [Streptomyces sp. San01]